MAQLTARLQKQGSRRPRLEMSSVSSSVLTARKEAVCVDQQGMRRTLFLFGSHVSHQTADHMPM